MKLAISFGFFLPVPPARGGATEKIWYNLAQRLAARGHDILTYSRCWPGWPDTETVDGVTYHRLPGWDHRKQLWQNLLLDLRWSLQVRRVLPPDAIVLSHNVSLPIVLRRWGRPHPSPVTVLLGRMPKGQVRFYRRMQRIYATSEAVATRVRYENPAAATVLKVLRNTIDWNALQGRAAAARTAPFRIGFAGRIHPEKGLDLLVDAGGLLAKHSQLPAWEIVFIGAVTPADGGGGEACVQALRDRAVRHGIADRMQILPPAWDAGSLANFYRTLSVFCYPTRAEKGEGLSVAPIEGMAAGAVPVLSTLDCYRDLIRPTENGLLFNHRSPNAAAELAKHLETLLLDGAMRTRLAESARQTARHFDYDAVAAELESDLLTLV